MQSFRTRSVYSLALAVLVLWGAGGCAPKKVELTPAQKAERDAASLAQTRAIAEEGYIYGLPLVMNYAVMHRYAINHDSDQWKAPFNELHNERHVFTPADTAVVTPNSDTPYSLAEMDLRAEPMVI